MAVVFHFLAVLATCAVASGQTLDLWTFSEVRAVLERGGAIVLDVDGSECESNFPYPDGEHRYISLPFRDWAYWSDGGDNVYIRANDFYVQSQDPVTFPMGITTRQAVVRPDNTVAFHFRAATPSTGELYEVDLECVLGRSARAFELGKDQPIDHYYSYQAVKAALLLGKHVDAIMFGEACQDTAGWLPAGEAVHYGHRIVNFGVFNDATPDEYLIFYHSNLYSNTNPELPPSTSWTAVGYALFPNGTVFVPIGIFEPPDWTNQWTQPAAVCNTGVSMQFSSFREQDATYITYDQVKDATLKGHDIELVVFSEFCEVVSGPAPPNAIIGHRFDQFQFFEAGDIWGPEEHITYSAFAVSPNGVVVLDEVRLYESNRVVFDWFRWNSGNVGDRGEISCALQTSAVFHSISRERGPSFNYVQIMRAIKNEGAVFELEIRYDGCDRNGNSVDLESIFGAVLWETYIRENEFGIDYEFAAPVFTAQSNSVTDSGLALWSVGFIIVTPDNTVQIYPRVYDWSGVDVTPFPDPNPIVCRLNTGGLDGSVYFFRYP